VFPARRATAARRDRRFTAGALAPRPASSTLALPVAALPRGATPPIRASVPGSPHYRDQFADWCRGAYHVVELRRERVDVEGTVTIDPGR